MSQDPDKERGREVKRLENFSFPHVPSFVIDHQDRHEFEEKIIYSQYAFGFPSWKMGVEYVREEEGVGLKLGHLMFQACYIHTVKYRCYILVLF